MIICYVMHILLLMPCLQDFWSYSLFDNYFKEEEQTMEVLYETNMAGSAHKLKSRLEMKIEPT